MNLRSKLTRFSSTYYFVVWLYIFHQVRHYSSSQVVWLFKGPT